MTEKKPKAKAKPKKKAAAKKTVKKKMGRPTKYTLELGDLICEQIASGKSLMRICENPDMPKPRTVYRWLREMDDFRHNYENAKEDQADAMVEEMLEIGNSADSENVQVARLQIDTRKWVASKFKSKRYGDKLQTENKSTVTLEGMSDEELDAKLNALKNAQ